ncbi:MAG TPA: BamA/TamA family outer membrane protein [Polyangiaceae bacterium]|nr:BamA/TamA family outer membrane protein [Polyangiaceae bacterium]
MTALVLCFASGARADQYLRWYTIETPHFRIHYHGGLEETAQRTASLAEVIRGRLERELGTPPGEVVHIRLEDTSDSANGNATAAPYDAIRLFVTAPEDMSSLGDYDDWVTTLVTHELTHVFHIDTVGGIPRLINSIIGKFSVPNQDQPHWILEGLAVSMESHFTGGGRLRSPLYDMYLRADVLEHHLATLDVMSHNVRRWPQGDVWYLYGGRFIGWILETYGRDAFSAVSVDYGSNIIPWGLNRSIKHATGRTYTELYRAWVTSLEERYAAQTDAARARGLREGTRLTHGGRIASNPRFAPACFRRGAREELVYQRDDGNRPGGFYRLPLDSPGHADESDLEIVARADGGPLAASFDPECGMVFDGVAPSERRFNFYDLHRQPPGTTSSMAGRGSRERWTTGLRARSPDLSPSGRRVAFVTAHAGTTTLRLADVAPEGGISGMRALVASTEGQQAFTPRFSPDGRHVVYSSWTEGGYRDIRIVDVETGRFVPVTHDRANDVTPSWSPDGRYVLWSSDRTDIANVYAYELATGRVRQVTNVLTGAFMPELSPDGRTLVYVGYTSNGFDLYSMPWNEQAFLDALPAPDTRPPQPTEPQPKRWPVVSYDPLETLWLSLRRPYSFTAALASGTFGTAATLTSHGEDIVGLHSTDLSLTWYPEIGQFTGSVAYAYHPLPFSMNIELYRDLRPSTSLKTGDTTVATRDDSLGATSGIDYVLPGEEDFEEFGFSYTASAHRPRYRIGNLNDPFSDVLARPADTFLGTVRLSFRYSNAYAPLYGVSNERGFTLNVATDFGTTATGSDSSLVGFTGSATGYLPMPWLSHHAVALGLSAGIGTGAYPRFFQGGFADQSPFDAVRSGLRQTAFVLRGFPYDAVSGRQYNLANLEYRFPIVWVERGVDTLPVFWHALTGTLFADYGGAYDHIASNDLLGQYHLGLGGELHLTLAFGYFIETEFRLGWARGFGTLGTSQTYLVAAATF